MKQVLFVALGLFLSATAFAAPVGIQIQTSPFTGSLADIAEDIETQLADAASQACGGL